ncbi:MAG: 23S rRNA (pseudouridine(1915)-N(3))-methyltransferase RlmH, partial [Bacteroidetes bacterium]|nr:23S rRNA (pseudouridine(1915)-N(3))-methyltransferase RlmH [Bacteroidota bacterium]
LKRYAIVELIELKAAKGEQDPVKVKRIDSAYIEKQLSGSEYLVLLDETGKDFTSKDLAHFLQTQMNSSIKELVFVIGGAYGYSDELIAKARLLLSFSKLTFPHQLFRLIFMEQLYRAFTILGNEPYHHQ